MKYIKTLVAPDKNDPFYYSRKNIFYAAGYGMPNCTCFAWGKLYSQTGNRYTQICGNAGKWIGQAKACGLETGSTPKLGAVIVWKSAKAGHVGIVEEIYENGDLLVSNSQWKGKEFFLRKVTKASDYKYASGFTFAGFIYPGIEYEG